MSTFVLTSTNLLTNGSLEGTLSGNTVSNWTVAPGAFPASTSASVDTTHQLFGSQCYKLTQTNSNNQDTGSIQQSITLPTSGPQVYSLSWYMMGDVAFATALNAGQCDFGVQYTWYDGTHTAIGSTVQDFGPVAAHLTPDTWGRYSERVIAPGGAISITIQLVVKAGVFGVSGTINAYFDGIQFEQCLHDADAIFPLVVNPQPSWGPGYGALTYHGVSEGAPVSFCDGLEDIGWLSSPATPTSAQPVTSPALHAYAQQITATNYSGVAPNLMGCAFGGRGKRFDDTVTFGSSVRQTDVEVSDLGMSGADFALVATMQYQVTGALTANARAVLGVVVLDGAGAIKATMFNPANGPAGQGVTSGWQTLTLPFGDASNPPQGTWTAPIAGFAVQAGIQSTDGNPASGTIVIGEFTLELAATQPSDITSQTPQQMGLYPSPFCPGPGSCTTTYTGPAAPAQVAAVLGGVNVTILAGSFEVDDVINQRARAQFTVIDAAASFHFQQGQSINAQDGNGNLIWAGVVSEAKEYRMNWAGGLLHDIVGMDWAYLCDKRVANKTYVNQTAGAIFTDLVSTYLASEGVTALTANIQAGPTLPAIVFDNKTLTDCFKQLAQYANFAWWLDFQRNSHFLPLGATSAPFTFDGTQAAEGTVFVTHTNPLYRNRQIWRNVPVQTASQTEHFAGDNKRTTFTVGFDVASVPTITLNAASQTVGVAGIDTGKQWYWQVHTKSITQDSGGVKLISTDDLAVTYVGEYKSNIVSEDIAAETAEGILEGGTSGIVEVVEDALTTGDLNTVFLYASAKLKRFATTGKQLEFVTNTPGLASGQTLVANLAIHGISNESFLVQSVTIRDSGPWGDEGMVSLWYTVVAIDGPVDSTWVDYFTALSHATDSNAANVDTQTIITILASFAAVLSAMTGSVTYTALSCPICGPSTLCGTGTIVC